MDANEKPVSISFSQIEDTLMGDASGKKRDETIEKLDLEASRLKVKLNQGVAPEDHDKILLAMGALEEAKNAVKTAWKHFHES